MGLQQESPMTKRMCYKDSAFYWTARRTTTTVIWSGILSGRSGGLVQAPSLQSAVDQSARLAAVANAASPQKQRSGPWTLATTSGTWHRKLKWLHWELWRRTSIWRTEMRKTTRLGCRQCREVCLRVLQVGL